ncbi:hypothetical protein AV944_11135 [Sphingomonas sp. LK11]|nr:hypothetical protein AV944_11135 [Sphingomonas sp. LK11]
MWDTLSNNGPGIPLFRADYGTNRRWGRDVSRSEIDANARLIAASPTLLEALTRAADEIEDLRKYANNHGGMIDNERCDYARAAITLATGKDA